MRRWMSVALLAWTLLAACTAYAAMPPDDKLVERIGQAVRDHVVVRSDFTQTRQMSAMKRPLITRGTLIYAPDHGVLWQIETPYRMTYVLGSHEVLEISADGSRRSRHFRDVAGLAQVGRIFRALFGADMAVLREIFEVTAGGNKQNWQLTLTPRQPEIRQFVHTLTLAGGRFVESIRIEEKNGDATQIRLRNTAAGSELAAAEAAMLGAGR